VARQVAIFTDDPGWHGARLREAFAGRGIASCFVSLRDCSFDLSQGRDGIVIPGFESKLPAGVFVRGVPGGTLEQVTFRLGILHALQTLGVPVYNDVRAIERTVDKSMTSFLLKRAGVPTPPTWVTESAAQARAVLMREGAAGREVVIKPLFGSQGTGLRRLAAGMDIPGMEQYRHVCYLQGYVESGAGRWHDHRLFVIAGRTMAAMVRRGTSWINNVAQGGRCEALEPAPDIAAMAEAAAGAVGADYAGVDIVRGEDGRPWVIEVNGIPAWKGLQSVARVDVAAALVTDFVDRHLGTRGNPVWGLEAAC
jgi:tetrahydromethanopterin:alpha-L-glutamate ligase